MESSPAPRVRCGRHGLATGPDGRCTLCKRADPPEPPVMAAVVPIAPRAAPGVPSLAPHVRDGGAHWLMPALGVFGLVLAAALAWFALGGDGALSAFDDDAAPVVTPSVRLPRVVQPAPARARTRTEPAARVPSPARVATATQPRPASTLDPWQRAEPQQTAAQRTPGQSAEEEQDRRRKISIESDRDRRALAHARGGVVVVMYSTSWCPSCKLAREYMTSNRIPFVDNDIDESASARAILKRLNPRGSIPTIDIDGEVMIGFGPEHLENMLDRAARKRAGI